MGQDEGEQATPSSPIHHVGPTLLSAPLANVVSLVTRSSSLYLRLGTFIGGLALDGARVTTLTGLEISRAIIESVLYRAGKDVSARATGELGRAEAEGLLEKSLATLHKTITSISFAASTGFFISAAALESAKDLSQQLLITLDSVLGSTDSSRAIASVITLIRREFQNPATGHQGEQVGVSDLLIGISGLALLQRWSRKITDSEAKRIGCEEVVWDVVVLDDGRRADVVGTEEAELDSGSLMAPAGQELARTVQGSVTGEDPESGDDMLEMNLKQRIMQALPPQASVSITTSTKTTKTITVEFTGAQPPKLSPPRGVEIVEEDAHLISAFDSEGEISTDEESAGSQVPRYRIVYRIIRKNLRGTNIQSNGPLEPAEQTLDSDNDIANHLYLGQPPKPKEHPSPPVLAAPQKPSATSHHNVSKSSLNISKADKSHGYSITPGQKDNTANQKRQRMPTESTAAVNGSDNLPKRPSGTKSPTAKRHRPDRPPIKSNERVGSIRNAFKKGSAATISNLWTKDPSPEATKTTQGRPPWRASATASGTKPQLPIPQRNPGVVAGRDAPHAPQRGNPNYFSSRDLGHMQNTPDVPRSPSRASYYSIHERRRDSIVSQTDTYSIHSTEARPVSPALFRTSLQAQRSLIRARSDKNIVNQVPQTENHHRRTKSEAPSIYTLRTNNSATSLVLSSQPKRSAFEDSHTFESLMRTGHVEGLFPQHHLVRNITRFVRFASASYGASFLRVMGLATSSLHDPNSTKEVDTHHHHEHHSFSTHTQLPPDTILLSSFVDPEGGTDSTGHTGTGVPMVHFVTLDHDSKAVVLTCRGTLGFEDVLTDMTCDYDDLEYNGASYKVHMGIHASARRLLSSRVFFTIKAALEEFPDYGLVLCGHSLGGGVTALLAIMISESSPNGTSFVTSSSPSYAQPRLLESASKLPSNAARQLSILPSGRPIHVYAYGPPATISPSLRLATRGLITTIVNGQDLVPHLSLGILHDLQAVALAFKTDDSGAKGEVRKRVWEGLRGTVQDKWYQNGFGSTPQKEEDDEWAHSALKTLRASMLSAKLLPPGEVFVIESVPVLRRDAFAQTSKGIKAAGAAGGALGRPATRSVLRYVRNVEERFSELRFGGSMLLDHNPGRYEASLAALRRGVLGS